MDLVPEFLANAAESHLESYGLALRGDLAQLTWLRAQPMTLVIDDFQIDIAVLYLPHLSATEALQAAHAVPAGVPLLVIGPRIHESSAEIFRARGIWYVDQAGNAFLRGRGLRVDIRGRRGSAPLASSGHFKIDGPRNPFSPKRAQVVMVLLAEPTLADAPFREIADRAGVSVGLAKSTVDTLERTGFLEHTVTYRRLVRGGELLDLWASAYPSGLGRANTMLIGRGDVQHWSWPDGLDIAVSGEQALPNEIRNPTSLVLYVDTQADEVPRDLILRNRWRKDPHGNIIIRKLFWRNLADDIDTRTAPAALVYADLLSSQEPRQVEVALEMRRRDERLVRL